MAKDVIPPLPEGFVLEENKSTLPPLPAGFVLENNGSKTQEQYDVKTTDLTNLVTKPQETITRTVLKSGGKYASDLFSAIGHPIQTAKAVGSLGLGIAEKLVPGTQEHEIVADSVFDFYKQRYGSIEEAGKTAIEDPVGFVSDLSLVLGGGGGSIGIIGKAAKLGKLAKIGKEAASIGAKIEPLSVATKAAGGFSGLTKGKALAPFKGSVDVETLKTSKEIGIDLPASAVSGNRAVALAESVAGKGFFGEDIIKKTENANIKLNKYADDAIKAAGGAQDMSSAGMEIFKAVDSFRNEWIKIKNELYSKAIIPREGDIIKVNLESTKPFISEILTQKREAAEILGKSEDLGYFESLNKKIGKTPEINGRELKSAIMEINEKLRNSNDPIVTGNKGTLKKMVTLMAQDLDNAIISQRPELSDAISAANKFYKDGITKLNSGYGQKIFDLSEKGQYDKILPAIMSKNTSVDDIPKIFEIIGERNVPKLRAAVIDDIISKSRSGDNFTPLGMTRQISQYGDDLLKATLEPKQFKALKNIETISKSLGRSSKISGGSQTAFIGRIMGEAALLGVNPLLGLKTFLGDVAFTKFISSKVGQKILTEGIPLNGAVGLKLLENSDFVGGLAKKLRFGGITKEEGE